MPSYSPRPSVYGVDTNVAPDQRYRIVGRIAAGGMAEIYLARMMSNAGVEREVVLKRLLPELQGDGEFIQMFHDEAQIASQLNHPNIVQIYELGELDGSLFIAMELLRGVNLRDLLARLHHDGKRMPLELAVRIACGCLEALDYAHSFADARGRPMNVVHRDVSPQNIIVTYEGTVKLVDFGVAKAEGKLHQTRAGLVKGKFAYMSPEQVGGGQIDGRSDLFAVAEVFYELMVHRHPFFAESDMDVLRSILDANPPDPRKFDPAFPAGLADIFMKAMRKDPNQRYRTAAAMQDALEHFLLENGTPATAIKLGRFIRKLFDDRMQMEQRARETANDGLLIEAMVVGRAERVQMSGVSPPPAAAVYPTDYGADDEEDATLAAVPSRNDPDRGDAVARDFDPPTDEGQGFGKQIRGFFGDEGGNDSVETMPPDEDAAEMPTMLGTLSASELAEVRNAARGVRQRPGEVSVGPASDVAVGPAVSRSGPMITRSSQPVDPAERVVPTPTPQPPVTTRSETVVKSEGAKKRDRLGLWFFIAGLGALVGAVVFAFNQLSQPAKPTMQLVVQSTPEGAAIFLDGFNTGAITPQTIPNIEADRTHTIKLELEGYKPFERKIEPDPELRDEPYVIHWRFQKLPPGGGE